MEKSELLPELQTIVAQFSRFRNDYSNLKTHQVAQDELIKLQKMELERMHLRGEKLASALMDYQKRFSSALRNFQSENQRLLKVIENMKQEHARSLEKNDEFVREAQRTSDDYIRRLEDDLQELRTGIASQEEKHREEIESMAKRHSDEISVYEGKLERMSLQENRLKQKIDAYEKKLEKFYTTERYSTAVAQLQKNAIPDNPEKLIVENKHRKHSHPALDDSQKTVTKKKKSAPAAQRWPQLQVSTKKDNKIEQKSNKKKKLYSKDNDAMVDLTVQEDSQDRASNS